MPTCFGPARRIVIDHFGDIYGRRFEHPWQFVRFAREQRLDLDLTTTRSDPTPGSPSVLSWMPSAIRRARPDLAGPTKSD
jgi:hypothetical protein